MLLHTKPPTHLSSAFTYCLLQDVLAAAAAADDGTSLHDLMRSLPCLANIFSALQCIATVLQRKQGCRMAFSLESWIQGLNIVPPGEKQVCVRGMGPGECWWRVYVGVHMCDVSLFDSAVLEVLTHLLHA